LDHQKIKKSVRLLLEGIGEDPDRPGLVETPDRVARMCEELYGGINQNPSEIIKVIGKQKHDEIILVRDVPFHSTCEHHLLPFTGVCHVAYIPDQKITGLSKLVRVVDICSRRLQVQERLTTEIAEAIMKKLKPKGIMVVMEAEHMCMTMRGVKKSGSRMITSVVRGIFRTNAKTRAEAMALISQKSGHIT
jgi:GTP cyclohydrolase I